MGGGSGVNLIGHLRSEGFAGQFVRQVLAALDTAGVPVFPIDVPLGVGLEREDVRTSDPAAAPFAIDLVCCAAGQARPGNRTIVWWPDAHNAHENWWDELPLPLALPARGVWPDRARYGLPEGRLVLAGLDPLGADEAVTREVIDGFAAAAAGDATCKLVVAANGLPARWRAELAGQHALILVERALDEWEWLQLMASTDGLLAPEREPLSVLAAGHAALLGRPAATAIDDLIRLLSDARADDVRDLAARHDVGVIGNAIRARLPKGRPGAATTLTEALAVERRLRRRLDLLGARIEDVAKAGNVLREDVSHVLRDSAVPDTPAVAVARPVSELVARHPASDPPWTLEYNERHRALVAETLAAPDLELAFGPRGLPVGFGRGFDERIVEYPWLLTQRLRGRTLDAGSVLNHPHILDAVLREVTTLDIVTLAPEQWSFPERGISYVYADLRELPYGDGHFDSIACISTLDHVGMDNSDYGSEALRAADPAAEVDRAVAELVRVLAPDGQLLITVPYGAAEDHGWLRQFDRAGVERIVAAAAPLLGEVEVFGYDERGWRRSSFDEQAGVRYRDYRADPVPVPDGAVAARGVACIRLTRL